MAWRVLFLPHGMSRLERRLLLIAVPLLATGFAAAAPKTRRLHLFDIQRSKNANVVRYDLRMDKRGRYDVRRPIDAYWVLFEDKGRREELNELEKKLAYGYRVLPGATSQLLQIQLIASPDRVLSIRSQAGAFRPEMTIAGEPSVLIRIYVKTNERRPWPTVRHVDLHGKSVATGKRTFERIRKR